MVVLYRGNPCYAMQMLHFHAQSCSDVFFTPTKLSDHKTPHKYLHFYT